LESDAFLDLAKPELACNQNPKPQTASVRTASGEPERRARGDRAARGAPTSTKPPHPWISSEAAAAEKKASRRTRRTGRRRRSIDRSDLAGAEHATGETTTRSRVVIAVVVAVELRDFASTCLDSGDFAVVMDPAVVSEWAFPPRAEV